MRHTYSLLLVLLSSMACTPPPGPAPLDAVADVARPISPGPPKSGTRIRQVFVDGTDGTRSLLGLHDSMLNSRCSWRPTLDGQTRCIPSAPDGFDFLDGQVAYFSQAGCAGDRLFFEAQGRLCPAPARYVAFLDAQADACAPLFKVAEVEALAQPPAAIWARDGMNCASVTPGSGLRYYRAKQVLPLAAFVDGTVGFE